MCVCVICVHHHGIQWCSFYLTKCIEQTLLYVLNIPIPPLPSHPPPPHPSPPLLNRYNSDAKSPSEGEAKDGEEEEEEEEGSEKEQQPKAKKRKAESSASKPPSKKKKGVGGGGGGVCACVHR